MTQSERGRKISERKKARLQRKERLERYVQKRRSLNTGGITPQVKKKDEVQRLKGTRQKSERTSPGGEIWGNKSLGPESTVKGAKRKKIRL